MENNYFKLPYGTLIIAVNSDTSPIKITINGQKDCLNLGESMTLQASVLPVVFFSPIVNNHHHRLWLVDRSRVLALEGLHRGATRKNHIGLFRNRQLLLVRP